MFGEVKLGEADYTAVSGKHCYACQMSYVKYLERVFWSLKPFQGFLKKAILSHFAGVCFS